MEHDATRTGRLPALRYDELDGVQRALWDKLLAPPRNGSAVGEAGLLQGPYNAMVTAPAVGEAIADLGEQVRFHTSLGPRLTEVAIMTVGVHYRAEVEWWAHSRLALEAGVSEDAVELIGAGRADHFEPHIEWLVSRFALELTTTGRVGPDLYTEVEESLGAHGVVELVTLVGYYVLISFLLNAFEVPLPAGATPRWT